MIADTQMIYTYLNSSSALKTAIGANLFSGVTHSFNGSTQKGIRFNVKSGDTIASVPVHTLLVDFFCYGGSNTLDDSREIYRLLHDRLHCITNQRIGNDLIIGARQVQAGQTLVEPDTKWVVTFTTYEIILA